MVGDKIPNEFELAEKFGTGRSTIREAVKSLSSKGVLEVRQGSGTFVISPSTVEDDPLRLARYNDKLQLALELFDVRLMIEPEIAAHAAVNVTDDDIKEIIRPAMKSKNFTVLGKTTSAKILSSTKKSLSAAGIVLSRSLCH